MSERNIISRSFSLLSIIGMFMLTSCGVTTGPVKELPTISQPSVKATPTAFPLGIQVIPQPQQTPNLLMPELPTSAPIESYFIKIGESDHFRYYQDHGYQPVEEKAWSEREWLPGLRAAIGQTGTALRP